MSSSPTATTIPPATTFQLVTNAMLQAIHTASLGLAAAAAPTTTTAPAHVVSTPEEVTGALRDIATAVQGIRLYLAGPYVPPPAALPAPAIGLQLLPWK
ncbi:hypothetical protein D1007_57556 [Hordeum vulgare]|nr:hypothetical protein D1007_57556 [Hordeum vulgare]